jgi:hypothetical protein
VACQRHECEGNWVFVIFDTDVKITVIVRALRLLGGSAGSRDSEMFQSFDEAPNGVFRLQPVEKVGPGFTIRLFPLDHGIGYDQDRVGHRQNHAPLAAATGQPHSRSGPTCSCTVPTAGHEDC